MKLFNMLIVCSQHNDTVATCHKWETLSSVMEKIVRAEVSCNPCGNTSVVLFSVCGLVTVIHVVFSSHACFTVAPVWYTAPDVSCEMIAITKM